ncbi:MAG TPA: hypothetical protein VKB38_13180 [Terracidiphilus sp.]|nr:hypothetical protein [Terracidiphilus sp.]
MFTALRQRIMQKADKILDAQMILANGQQFLYKIEKEWVSTGGTKKDGTKQGFWRPKKPELVEAEWEIRSYIDNLAEHEGIFTLDDPNDESATYYFITVKEPSNQAIDSMFNRAFGKATDHIDITTGGNPLPTPIYGGKSTTDAGAGK